MQAVLPPDIHVSYEFDQSPYVTRAIWGVVSEGALGAVLVGLMILLFLRDWRSAIIVLLNIPLALMAAVVALWLTGQTINVMTLGGLALAIGILVDEATVEIENIHTQMGHAPSIARAVRLGNAQTAVPRLLAMVCILAVFISSFFMQGAPRAMFVPLSLAVGFSMVASYLLSSTFVPVLSVWLLRHVHLGDSQADARPSAGRCALAAASCRSVGFERSPLIGSGKATSGYWRGSSASAGAVVAAYLVASAAIIWGLGSRLGTEIFPDHRHRPIPPSHPRPGRNGHRPDRTDCPEGPGGHPRRRGRRTTCEMSLGYLGTIRSTLPDQRRVSMDAGTGRRGDVGGLEEGKRHPHRAVQRGTPRKARRRRCRACISPSSRPTSSTR